MDERQEKGGPYHHGDLRAALLRAAEEELAARGIEGFTLRGCARRAGVSHAAPAHHFKDVTALLTEMTAVAFERLHAATRAAAASAPQGTLDQIAASGVAYVRFALENPHHFRLMFRTERLDPTNQRAVAAGRAAFQVPVDLVGAYYGADDPMAEPILARRVMALWSLVHGFADLLLKGQFDHVAAEGRMELAGKMIPAMTTQMLAGDQD